MDVEYFLSDDLKLSNSTTLAEIDFDRLDAPANGQFELLGTQVTNETLLNLEDTDNGIQAVFGGYVFYENRDDFIFQGTPLAAQFDDETLATSLFGEATWEFVDGFYATLGARYERESRQREGTAFGIVTDLDETYQAFLPKAGLAYDVTEDVKIGAVVSRGFNPGGGSISFGASNAAGATSPDPALGPRAFDYELYGRAELLDDSLFLTANVFYSDFEDQQRVEQIAYAGGFTDAIISNTPEARAYGAEIGANYAPIPEIELFADLGLLQTEIETSNDPSLNGNEFGRAPAISTSFGALFYPHEDWTLGVDARYVGSYYSTDTNNELAEVDPFFVANAKISWEPFEFARVFGSVTNIFGTDAERRLFSFPASAPPSLANVVEPRVIWLGAELSF